MEDMFLGRSVDFRCVESKICDPFANGGQLQVVN